MYIARDKPEAARRWLERLFAATDRLGVFPQSGAVVPEIGLPEYRQLIVQSHRIIYRIDPDQISIFTIRASRQVFDPDDLTQ